MTRPVWQARRSSLRGAEGERGAVATLVAVLLAGGVIIGMLALSIDVGNIMWERRQLQNGADAASLALAQTCAKDATKCAPGAVTDLTPLVNANAADGLQQFDTRPGTVNGLCARGANSAGLPVCASATSTADVTALADCPPLPTWLTGAAGSATKYVEVYTRTRSTAADDTILPGFFSQALVGAPQASVSACARAAWGPAGPTNAIVLPLVISECDWKAQTGYTGPGTAVYPAAPQGAWPGYDNLAGSTRPWPAVSVQHAVYSKGNPTPCDTSSPGGTAPGGFAWLDTIPHANCLAQVSSGWAHGDTGADVECSYTELSQYWGRTVMVPVFDCLTSAPVTITSSTNCNSGVGNNTYYHISGYASFYLSGWWLNPNKHASVRPPGGYQCGNPDRCLFGWFTQDLVEDAPIVPPPPGGTPNYGLTSVQPAG